MGAGLGIIVEADPGRNRGTTKLFEVAVFCVFGKYMFLEK